MSNAILTAVKDQYGAVAASGLSTKHDGVRAVAEAFGYTPEELATIPAEANMGLSCGNPTAFASLRPGEVVVDLGCGGGLDVFLAAQKVGPTGRAIGIDMTQRMIDLARDNAAKAGVGNVEFHLATIDAMPLPPASVDVVISNCVINLAPDKASVFREIARVLKPGGRLAVSDIALKRDLPDALRESVMAYVGCIAGAIRIDEYVAGLNAAGFEAVQVVDSGSDLNSYAKVENQSGCCSPAMVEPAAKRVSLATSSSCCGSSTASEPAGSSTSCCGGGGEATAKTVHVGLKELLEQYDVNDYAASVKVYALKPR